MALSGDLGRAGYEPESVETTATVHLEAWATGPPTLARIVLDTRARVPGIEDGEFQELAEGAKRTARSRGRWPPCRRSK